MASPFSNKHRKRARLWWIANCVRAGMRMPRTRPATHILTIKSEIPPEQLERFRREWKAMVSGVHNAAWTSIYVEREGRWRRFRPRRK